MEARKNLSNKMGMCREKFKDTLLTQSGSDQDLLDKQIESGRVHRFYLLGYPRP